MKAHLILLAAPLLAQPRFEKDILPIFSANCFACHGGTATLGLDVRTAASAIRGSHQGKVITKGDSSKSLLYEKISKKLMPPPAFNLKLTDVEIEKVKQWIDAGAPSDEADANAKRWKEQNEHFEADARPLLAAKCGACHTGAKAMAGLDLSTLESIIKGSANGPVIQEGAADKSILIRRVANQTMPPKGGGAPLNEQELNTLRKWVDSTRFPTREAYVERTAFTKMEAPDLPEKAREWWSFQTPVKKATPVVKARARVRTPIDSFVLARLETKGLSLSPDATNLTLIRRAYTDLTGLPPTPKQVEEFLADSKPGAYERLIDKLLESPQYGERWGRFWLDAAGYSDAAGFDNCFPAVEVFDSMWRYRDYVVNAFNTDKPYNRFLVEQLAGDELQDWRNAKKYTPAMKESLIATGYLRSIYDRTDADIVNLVGERYDVLFDLMEKVSTGLLGLTVNCARCHSHKYDPIPQRDYYRMQSIFMPAFNPMNWKQPKDRWLPDVSKAEETEIKEHNAQIDRQIAELQKQVDKIRKPTQEKLFATKLATLPEGIRNDVRLAIETEESKRNEVRKYLAGKFAKQVTVTAEEIDAALKEDDRAYAKKLDAQMKTFATYRRTFEKIQALWEFGAPPVARLLQRGAVESPGPRVTPGVLTVLALNGDLPKPAIVPADTSGQRLAFAQWLTQKDHPLTARVFVNRIWMHHFGRGIVETPENFGKMGAAPTNPELLDWLSADFMENGWKLKRLHKMIMTSSVYRQQSQMREDAAKVDPENKLLWRKELMRLDAEAVRDSVLSVSGKLDAMLGGPPVKLKVRPDGLQELIADEHNPHPAYRRSLYIMQRRNYPHQFLQAFDFPTVQINCIRRSTSATPLQSLALMNDEFMLEHAANVAAFAKTPDDAYKMILGRLPDAEERELAAAHLAKQKGTYLVANAKIDVAQQKAMASLCHMLMSSNEFLYVD